VDPEREGEADLEIEKELAEVIDDVAAGREDDLGIDVDRDPETEGTGADPGRETDAIEEVDPEERTVIR